MNTILSSAFLDIINETMGICPRKKTGSLHYSKSKRKPVPNKVSPAKSKHINKKIESSVSVEKRIKAPLSLSDLSDEDVEGLNHDWEIDLWSKADLDWSNEARELKELHSKMKEQNSKYLQNPIKQHCPDLTEDFLFGFFKTLRLVDRNISRIDEHSKRLCNLEELSLTGNLIDSFDGRNLPQDIQILHLNANRLTACPDISSLKSLIHFGIGYNLIHSLANFNATANLISLDLSGNALCDLADTMKILECVPNLQILALLRNPLYFIEGYRKIVISKLPRLIVLDDINVSISERSNTIQETIITPPASPEISLLLSLKEMTGVKQFVVEEPADNRPADEIVLHFEAVFDSYNNAKFMCSDSITWVPDMIDVASSHAISFPVTKAARDTFKGTLTLKMFQKRYTFNPVPDENLLSLNSLVEGNLASRPPSSKPAVRAGSPKKEAARPITPKKDAGKKGPTDKGKKLAPGKGKKEDDVCKVPCF
ncbi:hypothetical protein BC830DRAFT_622731 [Chytriomyces sp. MP71]|nr:hypothetical protein BC830DRAFT_622731 [Chytriomyces sp. MP71]